jgi:hypothetical protein
MVARGPIEQDVRHFPPLVHASKRAPAEMHDESIRREWKRGDRYLGTSTRLFEVANWIASFDERSDIRSPGTGRIDKERVSTQPDVPVPSVPRSLPEKRGACTSGNRHCLSRRIWSRHHAVRIQQPEPRTIAISAGRARSAMRLRLEDVTGAVRRSVVDHDHRAEFGTQESVKGPQQNGDKALRVVVHCHDHNTRGVERGIRVRPPRRSLSNFSAHGPRPIAHCIHTCAGYRQVSPQGRVAPLGTTRARVG